MQLTITRRPLYYWIGIISAVNILLIATTRAKVDVSTLPIFVSLTAFSALGFFIQSRRAASSSTPHTALVISRNLLEGLLFLQLTWLNLRLLNHLTMMIPFPYWDDALANWDKALGFNWVSYFEWVHARPTLISLLDASYQSLTLLSVVALLCLIVLKQTMRARFFCDIFFVTALICIVVGAFFPALAAVATQVEDLSVYSNFHSEPGSYHLQYLDVLRDPSANVVLFLDDMPGLVTFPSFHTAGGILLCVAYFRTWLFVPVMAYSAVMIASTPVFGGHYFVDLIAGAALALVVSAYFARKPEYSTLFARSAARRSTGHPKPA